MSDDTQKDILLDAALAHVPFDGWSQASFDAAIADAGIDRAEAQALFPRGPVDMALAYHQRGDAEMVLRMQGADFDALKYSQKIAAALRFRLEVADRELVRKGMALFALPQHAGIGASAVWQTCGLIWETLGDTSRDVNWYTKRATLSGVYSSTVLFWLGDDSDGNKDTWDFIDRRIGDVMRFEAFKGKARETGLFKAFMRGPGQILDQIKAPGGDGK